MTGFIIDDSVDYEDAKDPKNWVMSKQDMAMLEEMQSLEYQLTGK